MNFSVEKDKSFPMDTEIVGLIKNSNNSTGYIFGENNHYVIPEYQREYSWGETQIESFVSSIERAIDGESVFMGTVQFNNAEEDELHIIDGQQRMTTFLLLCNLIEMKTGDNIVEKNNIKLNIRNFNSNNEKFVQALAIKWDEADRIDANDNRYIENKKFLKNAIEELRNEPKYKVCENESFEQKIMEAITDRIYFVELKTNNMKLSQVVGIFNTINTTGLALNCSDLFKLQYYDYLKKSYPDKTDWMLCICKIYEEDINKNNKNMNDILDIYKHCIVAKLGLGWEMLSKSNESFFEEIFDDKFDVKFDDKKAEKANILQFDEFKKIVKIYLDLEAIKDSVESILAFSVDIIWMTRYGRYWTLPYVAAYFNNNDYILALNDSLSIAKYFIVCSINFDKVINPVHTFICNIILPAISRNERIEDKITDVICESPYEWKRDDNPNWNKKEFTDRIKYNLCHNGKRARIICTLSALLEEINAGTSISDIKLKIFDWKNFQYDLEHIYARNLFEKEDKKNSSEYNGIGNLVVLNRSINRDLGDKTVEKKLEAYEESSKYRNEKEQELVSVKKVAEQIRDANNSWGIEQVRKRQDQQVKLLCDFLGLNN